MATWQEFADTLAECLSEELEFRKAELRPISEIVPGRKILSSPFPMQDTGNLVQITVGDEFSRKHEALSVDELRNDLLPKYARELATKIARPFTTQFYEVALPYRTYAAVNGKYRNVTVRVVVDYYLTMDAMIYRFDTVVGYEDGIK